MGKISLNNIRIFAYHGCLLEESKIGSDYRVDLIVWAPLSKSSESDLLEDTIDYVLLNRIVREEMAIRSALLEHVAQRILNRVFGTCERVKRAKISVSKINPPIGGDVEAVSIILKQKRK